MILIAFCYRWELISIAVKKAQQSPGNIDNIQYDITFLI